MAAPLSSEREKLAEKLSAIAGQRRELEQLRRAAGPAREAEHAAAADVERAEAALQEARLSTMSHAIAGFAGAADGPPPDIARARAAIEHAKERQAIAAAVRDEIERRRRVIGEDVKARTAFVDDAATVVLWSECLPAARALADRLAELQREMIDKAIALAALIGHAPRPLPDGVAPLEAIATCCTHTVPLEWPIAREPGASPTAAKWREAYEALKGNATALLPK